MYSPLHCIALRSTAVNDSRTLLSVWSREAGRITLAFPAGASREARRRRALSAPMAMFEGCCDIRPSKEVLSMKDFMPSAGSIALAPVLPMRNIQATFLGEVLDLLTRRAAPDEELSDYLFEAAELLPKLTRPADIANFHLVFLFGLTQPLGITPDLSGYHTGALFDMRQGIFLSSAPLHNDFLDSDQARFLATMQRIKYQNMHAVRLNRVQRRQILDVLLEYFNIHLGDMRGLKTLAALSQ